MTTAPDKTKKPSPPPVDTNKLTFDSLKPQNSPSGRRDDRVPMMMRNRSAEIVKPAEWEQGVLECFKSPSIFLGVCCCTACSLGQTASIALGGRRNVCMAVAVVLVVLTVLSSTLQNVQNSGAMAAGAIFYVLSSVAAVALVFYARARLRETERLEGSSTSDFFYACCCNPCSTCSILAQFPPYRGPFSQYTKLDESPEQAV